MTFEHLVRGCRIESALTDLAPWHLEYMQGLKCVLYYNHGDVTKRFIMVLYLQHRPGASLCGPFYASAQNHALHVISSILIAVLFLLTLPVLLILPLILVNPLAPIAELLLALLLSLLLDILLLLFSPGEEKQTRLTPELTRHRYLGPRVRCPRCRCWWCRSPCCLWSRRGWLQHCLYL